MPHIRFDQRRGFTRAVRLVRRVCRIAGEPALIAEVRRNLREAGVVEAIGRHDNDVLFTWLMEWVSYQGVSDAVAAGYMDRHGRLDAAAIERAIVARPSCPLLQTYWSFEDCGFRKTAHTCSRPDLIRTCPLPQHDLRNGRLNQTAYSLYLFLRDVAQGDFVGWVDAQLAAADCGPVTGRSARLASAVVEPMANVHGVSIKVLTMAMSWLMLAAEPERERWHSAGAAMIAIDTLVHNWLHRTGILKEFRADHLYGPACYAVGACADTIMKVSRRIDASAFNPDYPSYFPRFVQHAVWRFCSQSGLDECNGNRIDDRMRCKRMGCALVTDCKRVVLKRQKSTA